MLRNQLNAKFAKKLAKITTKKHTYYAAITADVKQKEARIIEDGKGVHLQVYDTNDIKRLQAFYDAITVEEYNIRGRENRITETTNNWNEKNPDFALRSIPRWDGKLTISPNGLIEGKYNIFSSDFLIAEENQTSSSELKVKYNNNKKEQNKYSDHHLSILCRSQAEFIPDILYAIPKEIWQQFITALPDQAIVKNLNLAEHRHLWQAYNFSMLNNNDATIRHFRSDAFGKYHFLTNAFDPNNPYDCAVTFPYQYDERSNVDFNKYVTWRRNTENNYQHDYRVIVHHQGDAAGTAYERFDIDINFRAVFAEIDQGKSPATILTNRLPYLTPLFLNKFAHCPLWRDVHNIGMNLILPRVSDNKGTINKRELDSFIADLPSSTKSPTLFAAMTDCSRQIPSRLFKNNTTWSHLFYQARPKFESLHKNNHQELLDYFTALLNDLIFPLLIRTLSTLSQEEAKSLGIRDLKEAINCIGYVRRLHIQIRDYLLELLPQATRYSMLLSLQERWHRNVNVIEASKPLLGLAWHALFSDIIIDDVTFTCLTTEKQLKAEGESMHHCVGGYAYRCVDGGNHIIKITTPSGKRATLQLKINYNDSVEVVQNNSQENTIPCEQILAATKKLVDKINNKELPLNVRRGKLSQEIKREEYSPLNGYYPYPLTDEALQEKIYQAYKKAQVLPAILTASDYQAMSVKIKPLLAAKLPEITQEIEKDIKRPSHPIKTFSLV